jgi:Asp-tRNA(Asn)/Glu-tRNA(Gln) amidotransferase A subunit family amidase
MIPSNYLTATQTMALVAEDEVSLKQVIQDHQERYEQRNDQVKAWVCVDHTGAKEKVLEGPLRGMVIGIKDIISTSQPPLDSGRRVDR